MENRYDSVPVKGDYPEDFSELKIEQDEYGILGITPDQFAEMTSAGIRLHPERVAFFRLLQETVRKSAGKIFMEFEWESFNQRRFPVIGVTDGEHLLEFQEQLSAAGLQGIYFDTLHYQGLYYHGGSDFGGLMIAPRPEFLTVDQVLFQSLRKFHLMIELKSIGPKMGLDNLAVMDEPSVILLEKTLESYSLDHLEIGLWELDMFKSYGNRISFSEPLVYWCEIFNWLRQYHLKVYMIPNCEVIHRQKFSVVGVTVEENFDGLQSCMLARNVELVKIETQHFRGFCCKEPSHYGESFRPMALFIMPKGKIEDVSSLILHIDFEARFLMELQFYGRDHQFEELASLDFPSGLTIGLNFQLLFVELLAITRPQLMLLRIENTHQDFMRYTLELINGDTLVTDETNTADYSHTHEFSRIYYHEIQIINRLLSNRSVSIHDVGTCTAQFPLLLQGLAAKQQIGFKISRMIASDYRWIAESDIQDLVRKLGYEPIELMDLDLTKDIPEMSATDVIIANDVLEHLPDDQTAFTVLMELWRKTNQLLIVHVPIEDPPNPLWDHYVGFNETKLREWVNKLPNGRLLSDQIFDGWNTLISMGYLFIAKDSEPNR